MRFRFLLPQLGGVSILPSEFIGSSGRIATKRRAIGSTNGPANEITDYGSISPLCQKNPLAHPRERKQFRSFVAQYAVDQAGVEESECVKKSRSMRTLRPIEIDVLAPERTLFEKLAMLHDLASRYPESEEKLERAGRHYYHVYKVLESPVLDRIMAKEGLARSISADTTGGLKHMGGRPEQGYAASPAFDVGADSFVSIRRGLRSCPRSHLWRDAPN